MIMLISGLDDELHSDLRKKDLAPSAHEVVGDVESDAVLPWTQ
jgi:hypothetical protein